MVPVVAVPVRVVVDVMDVVVEVEGGWLVRACTCVGVRFRSFTMWCRHGHTRCRLPSFMLPVLC